MANLPNVSDLLPDLSRTKDRIMGLEGELGGAKEKQERLEREILGRYRDAGVTPEECDHPVVKHQELTDYCGYCRSLIEEKDNPTDPGSDLERKAHEERLAKDAEIRGALWRQHNSFEARAIREQGRRYNW